MFWPLSETFIRWSWYSVLLVLDTMGKRRVNKAVVLNKVRRQIESKRDKKTRKQRDSSQWPMVVIPYVENVSEAVARMMSKHNVHWNETIENFKECSGTSKDEQQKEDLTECVYKVACANCDKTYISKTKRKFGVRLQEHRNPKHDAHSLEAFVHQL